MRNTRHLAGVVLVAILGLLLTVAGCERAGSEGGSPAARQAEDLSPEKLGRLGARLEAHPEVAEEILEAEGLTWEQFGEAVREIASDAELALRYEAGYRDEAARLDEDGAAS